MTRTLRRHSRGVILPIVLLVLLLVGLLAAIFSFRVNADLASTQALVYRLQTRLAAEAGIERIKAILRDGRFDIDRWYHNPDELHRVIVWAYDTDPTTWGTNEEFGDDGREVYRFSLVADDPTDDEDFVRFGVTDESAKLNLNEATEKQLAILVSAAVAGDPSIDVNEVVDAILDWRDRDRFPRSEQGDTEGNYYLDLDRPYRVKNGPFDTVEELLLVKGVTGRILYGEDFDRNGMLTPNEDDGDLSFPPDDEDGILNRGLYPYLTVWSMEAPTSLDNQRRVYLFSDEATLRAGLEPVFPDDPNLVNFIVMSTRGQGAGGGRNINPTGTAPGNTGNNGGTTSPNLETALPAANTGNGASRQSSKLAVQQQVRDAGSDVQDQDQAGNAEEPGTAPGGESGSTTGGETNGGRSAVTPIRSPASLLLSRVVDGVLQRSPLDEGDLSLLMDRLTTVPPDQVGTPGLININTAPPLVLSCIEELSREQIGAIVDGRGSLSSDDKATTAWLLTEGIMELPLFEAIAPRITASAQQFTIESLGYADHVGMVTRLQVVIDMMGPIPQTMYYRDLTKLGGSYPVREDDLENIRGR